MNYFRDPKKAQEWFKLGMELQQLSCFFGYFQCCITLKNWIGAKKCIETINNLKFGNITNESDKENISIFIQVHKDDIKSIEEHLSQSIEFDPKPSPQLETMIKTESKWGF